ncbi:MAG: N-sulfoglucosamine sulfohydrolase [Paracoccaceae bacterium]|jgi:N-sulfoglucosamine sulfohydrolase
MQNLSLVLAFILTSVALAAPKHEKPNILLLFADDLGRYASAYASKAQPSVNDIISTPTFDRIASEGVLATNAFVSAPSCSPCRASLISGRHFFTNGSCSQLHHRWHGPDQSDPWNDITGYAEILQKSGYHIGLTHKNHVKGDRFGPQFSKAGRKVNSFSQNVSKAKDAATAKEALYEECRDNFRQFLAKRKEGQPFLYHFHPTNPHRKWTAGSGKKLWNLDPDHLKGKMPPFLPDVPVIREDMADYLGEAMAFDECCRVLLEELKATGEYDNTLIVISGDHGAPGFPRGKTNCYDFGARVLFAARWPQHIQAAQVLKKPISLIDLAPTFLAAADLKKANSMHGENLLPALGSGDHSKLRSWALIGREAHVEAARARELPYSMRSIRTADHLYIINFTPTREPMGDLLKLATAPESLSFDKLANNTRLTYADVDAGPTKAFMILNRDKPEFKTQWDLGFGPRPAEELYELESDPHQVKNLAKDPAHQRTRDALHAQLMDELQKHKDPRLNGDQFDFPPYCKIGLKKK